MRLPAGELAQAVDANDVRSQIAEDHGGVLTRPGNSRPVRRLANLQWSCHQPARPPLDTVIAGQRRPPRTQGSAMTSLDSPADYQAIPDLAVSFGRGVLSVTFNRPDSLNSLTSQDAGRAGRHVTLAATDPRVRCPLGGAGRTSVRAGIGKNDQTTGAAMTPEDVLQRSEPGCAVHREPRSPLWRWCRGPQPELEFHCAGIDLIVFG